MDRNRKLQLAGVLTVVLSRMASAPDVFSDEDVFRNTRNERLVIRKSMYDWLKRAKRIEGHPDGYRVLDRASISADCLALKRQPIQAVNAFLNSHDPYQEEETEEAADGSDTEEEEQVEDVAEEKHTEPGIPEPDEQEPDEQEPAPAPEDDNYPPEEESSVSLAIPDVKETMRELSSMISDAGTKNRARYVLAINALTVMIAGIPDGTFYTRKEMFTLWKHISHEKCVSNEVAAKSWQKVFLDRTEEVGLTEKTLVGRDSGYRVADGKTNEVILMVSDAVHKDGMSLRRILWPGQYGEEEAEEPEPEEAQDQNSGIEVLSELVGQLTTVAESMSAVNESMRAILSGMAELGEQSRERERRAQESLESVLSGLSSIVSRLDLEERGAITSMKDRLVEIQTRRRSLSNQLESEISRESKLLEEMEAVIGRVKP